MTSIRFQDPALMASVSALDVLDDRVIAELQARSIRIVRDLAPRTADDLLASTSLSLADVIAIREALMSWGIVLGESLPPSMPYNFPKGFDELPCPSPHRE